jgi:hypothetical protein
MSYTAKIEVRCWKEHTCSACRTVYRYLFKRTKSGTGGSEQAAGAAATRAVVRAIERETEMRPCPACGLYQPEMVGFRRARAHWWLFWITLGVFAVLIFLGMTALLRDHVVLWIGMFAGACLAFGHLVIAILTPNTNTERNIERAKDYLEDGTMEATTVSKEEPEPVPDPKGGAFWGIVAAFALVLLLIVAAELMRLARGWPLNLDWYPQVAGPGDRPYTWFNERIETVGGYWRPDPRGVDPVRATVQNADELKVANARWTAETNKADWGDRISVKSGEKRSSRRVWMRVNIPPEENLAGKEVKLNLSLDVEFPTLVGNNAFQPDYRSFKHATTLRLGSPRAGATYTTLWWVGLVGGGLLSLALSAMLIARANGLIRRGDPTRTYPVQRPGESGEEPPDQEPTDGVEQPERRSLPRDREE